MYYKKLEEKPSLKELGTFLKELINKNDSDFELSLSIEKSIGHLFKDQKNLDKIISRTLTEKYRIF